MEHTIAPTQGQPWESGLKIRSAPAVGFKARCIDLTENIELVR